MAPEAVDVGIKSGFDAADQQSHLQTILRNTRANKEHEAQLKAQQEEMFVAPEAFREGTGAHLAAGTSQDGKRLRFKDAAAVAHAFTQDKLKYDERQELDANENTAKGAVASGAILPSHPAYSSVQAALGRKKLSALQAKHMEDIGRVASSPGKDTVSQDVFGTKISENKRVTVAPPPVAPGHRRTTTIKDDGTSTYTDVEHTMIERAAVGSMKEDGWTEDHPRYHTEFANRVNKMMPWQEGGGLAPRSTGFNKPPGAGVAPPPAGVAPAAGAVSGAGAEQGGTQAAEWLREKAKDPALSPEDRQALLKAAKAANTVAVAGTAQAGASAPAAPSAPSLTKNPNGSLSAPLKPADTAQISKAQGLQSAIASIDTFRKYIDMPEVKDFRGDNGLLTQVLARGKAKVQDKTHFNMGVPENAQAARAALVTAQGEWRRSLAGVAVTPTESQFLENVVTTDISDPALGAKVAELERMMHKYWKEIEVAAVAQRRSGIAPAGPDRDNTHKPGAPAAAKPPAAGVSGQSRQWTRDASGKLVPR